MYLIVRGLPGLWELEEGENAPWEIQEEFLAKMPFRGVEFRPVSFKKGCGRKGRRT